MIKTSLLLAGACACMLSTTNAQIVINEAYGGGGNSGSTYTNDFIELFNNSTASIDISGYQLAYASSTGAFSPTTTGTDTAFVTIIPAGTTLAAGALYLIQEAKGTAGTTALPSPNLVDTTPIALSGTTFKLELVNTSTAAGTVLDLLGVGPGASAYEGAGPAPIISNTTSASRIVDGVDTNNNNLDFAASPPTPGSLNVPEPSTAVAMIGGIGALITALRLRKKTA